MTETAPTLKLHSIMVGVRDIERSLVFYTNTLGLTLRERFGDFAFLDVHGATVALSAQLYQTRPAAAPAPVEIVLSVDGVRDAYARLRRRGVTFLNEPHTVDGMNDVAHFEDPDGQLFSLYGPP